MKYCSNCGQPVTSEEVFCKSCGIKILNIESKTVGIVDEFIPSKSINFETINQSISLKNNQSSTVNISLLVAFISLIIIVLPFYNNNPLTGFWAIALIGMFVFLSAIIVAFIFKSRAKKLQTLITGENVLASWKLNENNKSTYVNYLFENEKAKNKGIFWITTILIVVIFGFFILILEEGKGVMFLVMFVLIGFIGLFAFGMPIYYKNKNLNGDGNVLIGKKFAYINGFFHNWDFPLSGIKKSSVINEPFYGLQIQYYYTDRTFTNTEELNIPAPQELDLKLVINELKG